jgi:hypothetical protein
MIMPPAMVNVQAPATFAVPVPGVPKPGLAFEKY